MLARRAGRRAPRRPRAPATWSARRACSSWSGDALRRRVGEGIATGALSDQASAIARLFGGVTHTRRATIAFELAGDAGAAWLDDDGPTAVTGNDFLMRQVSCIGGGTTEMARNVISERVLGMPRERTLDRDVAFRDVPRSAPAG